MAEPFATVLAISSLMNLDLDSLNFGCVVPGDPVLAYCGNLFGFAALLAIMLMAHFCHVLVFHAGRFWEHIPALIGATGTTFMAVFVTISAAVFAAFRYDKHPNGVSTVQSLSQVICWTDGQHQELVIVGFIGSIIPLAFLSLSTWIVFTLPSDEFYDIPNKASILAGTGGRQSSSGFAVPPGSVSRD